MAKTQNLSLNPTKISGTCGRLMCCLKYEQDAYEDLIRNSPKLDSFVDTPEGRGTVVELDLLRQRVKVRMEENPETVSVFANADIAVLRSGKAKKNDPPIPADLAPISGAGKRARKIFSDKEESMLLEPIRFRYSNEAVVEETQIPEEQPVEEAAEARQSRSRRRKKHTAEAPKAEPAQREKKEPVVKEPKPQKETAENKAPAEEAEAQKKHRRRPNHRRRKPKTGGQTPKE